MTELLQALIFGVLTGGVYALMATGLTLTFGVMKIVNLAQGAFLDPVRLPLLDSLWAHLGIDPLLGSLIVTRAARRARRRRLPAHRASGCSAATTA